MNDRAVTIGIMLGLHTQGIVVPSRLIEETVFCNNCFLLLTLTKYTQQDAEPQNKIVCPDQVWSPFRLLSVVYLGLFVGV
jgi:hypothetical protein